MTHHILVIGAGYTGLSAAKRAAARLGRAEVRVTLVNEVDRFVERVRLHQLAAGQQLADLPLASLVAGTGVELVVARVTGIETAQRRIRLDAAPHSLPYDTLVYALGSGTEMAAVAGVREHALTVSDRDGALRLRARVDALSAGGTVAVVGGGGSRRVGACQRAGARTGHGRPPTHWCRNPTGVSVEVSWARRARIAPASRWCPGAGVCSPH